MILAVTGHRPDKLNGEYNGYGPVSNKIREDLQHVINNLKPDTLISGMALGVDTIWAALALKNNIKLIAAIPCKNHASKWSQSAQRIYSEILKHPLTTIHMVSEEPYDNQCMQNRNIWMVDNSDILIAVHDGSAGGTKNCIKYAESKKKAIITIKPISI